MTKFPRCSRPFLRVLASVLLATLSWAQSTIRFDPARDLEEFEAASFSEYHDLYPIDAYTLRRGDEITPEELEGLRLAWKTDRERVAREIEQIRTDPREAWVYALNRQLANHTSFSRTSYRIDRSMPGVAVLAEKPYKEDAEHAAKIAQLLGPWLTKLEVVFDAQVVAPLGLVRRDEFPLWAVAILSSEASYREYARVDATASPILPPARYDPRLKMVVGFLRSASDEAFESDVRTPILCAYVHALMHGYYTGAGNRPASLWLNRGLAGYLATTDARAPEALGKAQIPLDMLQRVVDACSRKDERDVLLHPVEDLVQARDDGDVLQLAANRAATLAVAPSDPAQVMGCFDAQSVLWMHFLQNGQGGRFHPAIYKFLGSAMEGHADLATFRIAFLETDMRGLNREFYKFVFQEYERAFPKKKVDTTPLATLFDDRDPRNSIFGATVPAAALPVPSPVSPTFTPAALAIDPLDFEPQHALALVQARRGELEEALQRLRDLATAGPPPPQDARIARDIERIAQTIRLRDGYFEHLRATGSSWVTVYQRQELTTPIEKIEGGFVLLGSNKLGLSKIPLKTISPYEIARQAGQRSEQGDTEPWARFYPYILVGDGKWEKLLTDESPASKQLREDARDVYPELLRSGEAALELNALSKAALPETSKQAGALLASIQKLIARHENVPFVQRNLDRLRQLATLAALKTYVEKDPSSLLHGRVTAMGDGSVHVVYDFDEPREGEDFTKDLGYLASLHQQLGATAKSEAESTWKVENSEFAGVGTACYRHVLRFVAPLSVSYELRYGKSDKKSKLGPTALLAMCDDRLGNYLANVNFGNLAVLDLPHQVSQIQQTEGASSLVYGKVYALELRHDGTTVSSWLDGEKKYEAAAGEKRAGDLFLWFNTDYRLAIQKIEIHGKIDTSTVESLRNEYVSKKLAELGFH